MKSCILFTDMIEDPRSLSVRYASQMIGFKPPHFEEVDFPQSGSFQAVLDNFQEGFTERGGPRVLSLNFQGVSEVELLALEELAAAMRGFKLNREGMGKPVFMRVVNACSPLSETLSKFLDEKELVVAAVNKDETVMLLGNNRLVKGYSPAFLRLSQLTGWVRGAIYLHDQLGISSPAARHKLLAMFQDGIVIARGDVFQNGVVHSLV